MSAEYPSSVVMVSGRIPTGAAFSSAARLFRFASRVRWGTGAGAGGGARDTEGEVVGEGDSGGGRAGSTGHGTAFRVSWQLGWRWDRGPAPVHPHRVPWFQKQRGVLGGGIRNGYLQRCTTPPTAITNGS